MEVGQTQADAATAIGVAQNVISSFGGRFLVTGNAGRNLGQGCRRATMLSEVHY